MYTLLFRLIIRCALQETRWVEDQRSEISWVQSAMKNWTRGTSPDQTSAWLPACLCFVWIPVPLFLKLFLKKNQNTCVHQIWPSNLRKYYTFGTFLHFICFPPPFTVILYVTSGKPLRRARTRVAWDDGGENEVFMHRRPSDHATNDSWAHGHSLFYFIFFTPTRPLNWNPFRP